MSHWKGIVGRGFTKEDFRTYVDTLDFSVWTPQFAVLHNTQIPRLDQWHDVPGDRRMLGLQSYYRDEQKWSGGPHLFVADDLIWVFTPLTVPGVHSPSWNEVAWGVETVGDYDTEELPQSVFENVIAALSTLYKAVGLNAKTLRFHKEDPATTHRGCPGKNLVKQDVVDALAITLSVCS